MFQCLAYTEIRIVEVSVLPHKGNRYCSKNLVLACSESLPILPDGLAVIHELGVLVDGRNFEDASHGVEEPLAFKKDGNLVGAWDVMYPNNLIPSDLACIGDFLDGTLFKRGLATAGNLTRVSRT